MTRDEAIIRIRRYLGFRTDLQTEIIDALRDAQVELEEAEFLPWFLLVEVASISTTADEERVPVPSDFIRESEETALWYYDAAADADARWVELKKADIDTLRNVYQDETGVPKAYALDQLYFRIKPTPDAVYTLKLGSYFAQDTVLSTNVENNWLKHVPNLMIGKAGMLVAAPVRDANAYGQFQKMESEGMATLIKQNTAREMANRRLTMGGED